MTSPVRCRRCRTVYDLGRVTVVARYLDCSVWRCPGCNVECDDRPEGWGPRRQYDEIPSGDVDALVRYEQLPDGSVAIRSWFR